MKKYISLFLIICFISTIFYFLYFSAMVKIYSGVFPSYKGLPSVFLFVLLISILGEAIIGIPFFLLFRRKKILNLFSFILIGGMIGALSCGFFIMLSPVNISKLLIIVTAMSVLSAHVIVWISFKNELKPNKKDSCNQLSASLQADTWSRCSNQEKR